MGKCENGCEPDEGWATYCNDISCNCGTLTEWRCKTCGHVTIYYHATDILRTLLNNSSKQTVLKDGGQKDV